MLDDDFLHKSGLSDKDILEDVGDSIQMISNFLQTIIHPTSDTPDLEISWIESAVQSVVEKKGSKGRVSDVQKIFHSSDDIRKRDLGDMLQCCCKGGIYEKYFEGDANISFEKDMVVIELQELEGDKRLRAMIMKLYLMNITKHVYLGDTDKQTLIQCDEAAETLETPADGRYMKFLTKKVRKRKAATVFGSQNPEDFIDNPAANAILLNSNWVIVMLVLPASIEKLKNKLQLDEKAANMIRNNKPKKEYIQSLSSLI